MRAASPEGAGRTVRLPWFAVHRSNVEHRPVQVGSVTSCENLIRCRVQPFVVPDVSRLGGYDKVTTQQPSHARIHQGMPFPVDKQERCVGRVLPDCRNAFELFAVTWPEPATSNHFLCQSLQGRAASAPQPDRLQCLTKFILGACCYGFPAGKTLQEVRQEGSDSLGARALQQHFSDQKQVRACSGVPPRKRPSVRRKPRQQLAPKGGDSLSGNRGVWSFLNSHVKITRGRVPENPSLPWII